MDPPRIRPDLNRPHTWDHDISTWRSQQDDGAVLDLSDMGTNEAPIPADFLATIPSNDNRSIGSIDATGAHLSTLDWRSGRLRGASIFIETRFGGETSFAGAEFSRHASFSAAQFSGATYLTGAQFSDGTSFEQTEFSGDTSFNGAQFSGNTSFKEAQFGGDETSLALVRFSGDAIFDDAQFSGIASFAGAQFNESALFRAQFSERTSFYQAQFSGAAHFAGAQFRGTSYFACAQFRGTASFAGTQFSETTSFAGVKFDNYADFVDAEFTANALLVDVVAPDGLDLTRTVWSGDRHEVHFTRAGDPVLKVRFGVRVEGDLVVVLGPGVLFDASQITVRAPTTLIAEGDGPDELGGKLVSLERADVTAPIRIGRRIDLSETLWGDHDLTGIDLASTATLPRTGLWYRPDRQTIRAWQNAWAPGRRRLAADTGRLTSSDLAVLEGNYRDLRRQLEASGNTHGANDFYYGEMEARRRQLAWFSHYRRILGIYRWVSGYGTRAWTAVASWVLLTLGATRLLLINGVDIGDTPAKHTWGEVWRFVLDGSLSFFRSTSAPLLSTSETLIMVTVRVLGPVLLALSAIAVRNQTKR